MTNIGDFAFTRCLQLTAITVDALNSSYCSVEGACFNKNQTTLIQYPAGKIGSVYRVPSSVTSVASYAFHSCNSLMSIYFQGNAPDVGLEIFYWVDNAIVYYLPGRTGWGPTFGGRPTVLWTPQIQTASASFGVLTNHFGFTITGISGLTVVVEASTNLLNPVWFPLQTNTLNAGSSYFSDPAWTNYSGRFYRFRSP
ncbi:MAG: leucine-rich repeat protein [Verrucomicrobiota bacterium]